MNLWHDITYGKNAPQEVTAIIEVPAKSRHKYEIDKETGMLKLDRVLHSAVHYPGNYGFIPQTYCDDKDPLDIILLGTEALYPLTKCQARPIGVIHMIDGGEQDDKIIAVLADDPRYNDINDLEDVQEHLITEITHFFETYKLLRKKTVQIQGVSNAQKAKEIIKEAITLYQEEFE
jgi:inorganic pyrophosphatase